MDDIFNHRIKPYFKSITSGRYWKRDLIPRFRQKWDDFGDILDNMMRIVWNAFKQKDESDGTKYDKGDPRPPEGAKEPEPEGQPDTSAVDADFAED